MKHELAPSARRLLSAIARQQLHEQPWRMTNSQDYLDAAPLLAHGLIERATSASADRYVLTPAGRRALNAARTR